LASTPKPQKSASTQSHLPIAAIEDGVIVMKDGSYRAVLKVGSVNFMLKSEAEQNALIGAYQNFLNALDFHIQIVMQSRKLDLEPYLKKLEGNIPNYTNDLIKQQTEDYIANMRDLISAANIMDKQFYIVVPYVPVAINKGFFSSFFPSNKPTYLTIDQKAFQTHHDELMQRAGVVASGLNTIGIKSENLDTDGIIKMLYAVYNGEISTAERIEHPEELTSEVIEAASSKNPTVPQTVTPEPEEAQHG